MYIGQNVPIAKLLNEKFINMMPIGDVDICKGQTYYIY